MIRNVKGSKLSNGIICFVGNPLYGNSNGCYGSYTYDKKGNLNFNPHGSQVILEYTLMNIDNNEVINHIKFNTPQGYAIEVDLEKADQNETGILMLTKYGCQVDKRTAYCLTKVIENQELEAELRYCYEEIGWGTFEDMHIFKAVKGIGIDAFYNGKLNIAPSGSYDEWKSMVNSLVLGNVYLESAIAFGLSAVILGYIKRTEDIDNIIINMCGDSTTGKSTAASLAISTGCSPMLDANSLALSFNTTDNALIKDLTNNHGYPVMIDDASICNNKNFTSLLYSISGGKDKARLDKDCNKSEPSVFSTSVIITSEYSLLNTSDKLTGLLVRLQEYENITWTDDAQSAEEIKQVIQKHYGHAIIKMAEFLVEQSQENKGNNIFEIYNRWRTKFLEQADGNTSYAQRFSKKLAVIMTATEVGKIALDIDFDLDAIFDFINKNNITNNLQNIDIGIRAYNRLVQEIYKNNNRFRNNKKNYLSKDYHELWGVIEPTNNFILPSGQTLTKQAKILQTVFDEIVKTQGFRDTRTILRSLRDNGLLRAEPDRYLSDFDITGNNDMVKGYIVRLA